MATRTFCDKCGEERSIEIMTLSVEEGLQLRNTIDVCAPCRSLVIHEFKKPFPQETRSVN